MRNAAVRHAQGMSAFARMKRQISQPIINHRVVVDFHCLLLMRVMPENDAGAGIDGRVRDDRLILLHLGREVQSPVKRHDANIRRRFCGTHVIEQQIEVALMRRGDDMRRRARLEFVRFVERMRSHGHATGALVRGPKLRQQD